MCEKCSDMDDRITRYQRIVDRISDELTIVRIKHLITRLVEEKAQLHPGQEV